MEIKSETIKLIKLKVPLYKNKKFFKIFKDIFIDLTMKCIKNENFIAESKSKMKDNSINNKNDKLDDEDISYKNTKRNSLWFDVMKNAFTKINIKDYDYKNNHIVRNGNNSTDKYKKEEDQANKFQKNQQNKYEINNLVYLYLYHESLNLLEKLINISKKEKSPITNLSRIYLGLCSENLGLIKMISNENFKGDFSRRKFMKKFTIIEYNDKRFNTINNKENNINDEPKIYKKNNLKIRYISNLKAKLAKKKSSLNNKKSKEDNIISLERNKNEELNINNMYKEEEKNKNNFNTDAINEDFMKGIYNLNNKNKSNLSKVAYASSFARLFIGETDISSIRERYNSNMDVRKKKNLEKKYNIKRKKKNRSLSSTYLKMFLNKINQIKKSKLPVIEKNIAGILEKFIKNQDVINKAKKINIKDYDLYEDEKNLNGIYTNNNSTIKLQTIDNNNNINKNYISSSSKKNNNSSISKEIGNTPERKKLAIYNNIKLGKKEKNKTTNLSFNKKGFKNYINSSNYNRIINEYRQLHKVPNRKEIIKLYFNEQMNQDKNSKTLLTERNNLSKNTYRHIFRKNISKKIDNDMDNNKFYLKKNSILSNNKDSKLYNRFEISQRNNNVQNFLTKNDFFYEKYL